jgi:signal transduction histidine kinase/DNA-binding response OmpR family regulator
MKILLIEDNPGDARLLLEMLKDTPGDFALDSVERLGLGLEYLAAHEVDVVLLDLNLPDSSGLDTIARLHGRFSLLPVVIMTSVDDEELVVQAIRHGATDYLVKGQTDGRLLRRTILYAIERKQAEIALTWRNVRFRLLSETAGRLLSSQEPEETIQTICHDVTNFLDCQVFFNFLVDDEENRLNLNTYAGIPEEEADKIATLDFGEDLCGHVAREGRKIIVEHVQETHGEPNALIKSFGVKAFACYPLISNGAVIGTLAFGTRTRSTFAEEELDLMKTVTDQVATAVARKKAEAALQRNEEELATILASVPIIMLVVNPDRRVLQVNEAAAKFAGRRQVDMSGMRPGEALQCLYALDDPQGCGFGPQCQNCMTRLTVLNTLETGVNHYQVEWHAPFLRNGKQEEVTFLLSTVLMGTGTSGQALVCIEDISARKRTEEALQRSEERATGQAVRLQTVLDTAPAIIWIAHDRECRVITGNRAADDYLRVPVGLNVSKSGAEADRLAHFRVFRDGVELPPAELPIQVVAATGQGLADYGMELRFDDGTVRHLLGNISPLLGDSGEPNGAIGAFIDITERKKMDQLKDEFIGMVSHELKTPLTVVTGAIYTSMTKGVSAKDKKELLHDAVSGAEELTSIIDNLLELSRFQADRLQLNIEPVDVGQVARNVTGKLEKKSALHRLMRDIPETLVPVMADAFRVERILYNLVDNAIKYSPKGGTVTVSAREQDNSVVVTVTDQGIGISVENQARLFEPFQRIQQSHLGIAGVGLGLNVCKRLLEVQGGRIWVESTPGKGSTFSFMLPAAREFEGG